MSRTERGRVSVGIDIGGTKTAVLAVTLPDVEVLFRAVFPTRATLGAAQLRADIVAAIEDRLLMEGPEQ